MFCINISVRILLGTEDFLDFLYLFETFIDYQRNVSTILAVYYTKKNIFQKYIRIY